MSDVSQGGGWWIASDGKWYPPHLQPSAFGFPPGPAYPPGYGPPPGSPFAPQHPGANIAKDSVLDLSLAPWWKRFVAILIDIAVLAVPYLIAIVAIGAFSSNGLFCPGGCDHRRNRLPFRTRADTFDVVLRHHERLEAWTDARKDGDGHSRAGRANWWTYRILAGYRKVRHLIRVRCHPPHPLPHR